MTEINVPAGDDSADTHTKEGAPPAANEGDGAPRKKRRRRRRRGRKPAGDGQPQDAAAANANGEPDDTTDDAPDRADDADDAEPGHNGAELATAAAAAKERALSTSDIFANVPFDQLGLRNSVMKGVTEAGFTRATTIQAALIPAALAGKDVLGQAKTGSGKTAAFGLPLFHMATRQLPFQSLILCPTRELAIQITGELAKLGKYTPIKVAAVYGGQAIHEQGRELERGPEIIVATPGRLMDMHQRRRLHFDNVKFVVLDEVDRMLDIGFRDDIKKILKAIRTPHQTMFVSATISSEIEQLARTFMRSDVEKITTAAGSLTVSLVEQHYLPVAPWDKRRLLLHLLTHEEPALTVVFCRMKRTVDDLAKYLRVKGVDVHAIHGDMYQGKRNSVMKKLREGELAVLVASDLAARGLDVDDITHVVNYDLPDDPEVYIHRIGRTARAGRGGVAWSLVTPEQGPLLTQIEQLANVEIPKMDYPDFEPGPLPDHVRAQQKQQEQRIEAAGQLNRYAAPKEPVAAVAAKPDESKFPGGLVPTKLPPRMMGGRVKTSRSMKAVAKPLPPAEE